MVNKAWLFWELKKGGKELKVPQHTNAAAARDGNLPYHDGNIPYVKATCLYS